MLVILLMLSTKKFDFYRQHCTQHIASVFRLLEDFDIFRPTGAIHCTDGVGKYHCFGVLSTFFFIPNGRQYKNKQDQVDIWHERVCIGFTPGEWGYGYATVVASDVAKVRPYVRPSTKSFFDFNEIWCVGRGRRVMHDGMQYDPIRGQGHEPMKVGNSAIFKGYLFPPFTMGAGK